MHAGLDDRRLVGRQDHLVGGAEVARHGADRARRLRVGRAAEVAAAAPPKPKNGAWARPSRSAGPPAATSSSGPVKPPSCAAAAGADRAGVGDVDVQVVVVVGGAPDRAEAELAQRRDDRVDGGDLLGDEVAGAAEVDVERARGRRTGSGSRRRRGRADAAEGGVLGDVEALRPARKRPSATMSSQSGAPVPSFSSISFHSLSEIFGTARAAAAARQRPDAAADARARRRARSRARACASPLASSWPIVASRPRRASSSVVTAALTSTPWMSTEDSISVAPLLLARTRPSGPARAPG